MLHNVQTDSTLPLRDLHKNVSLEEEGWSLWGSLPACSPSPRSETSKADKEFFAKIGQELGYDVNYLKDLSFGWRELDLRKQ